MKGLGNISFYRIVYILNEHLLFESILGWFIQPCRFMGVWLWEGSFINSSKCGGSGNGGLFLNFLCVCFELVYWSNPSLCSLSHQAERYLSDSSNSFPGESSSVFSRKVLRNPGSIKNGRMKRSRLVTQQCFQIRDRDWELWLDLFTDEVRELEPTEKGCLLLS